MGKKRASKTETEMACPGKAFIGKPAPAFTGMACMPDGSFKEVKLEDYKGKYVVFFFYPLDWTFVCPTEIISFSEAAVEFEKNGCAVVGCSTDSHFSHLAWANTSRKEGGLGGIKIPLVSDLTHQIAKDYGVLLDDGIALRGAFVIDDKGVLRASICHDPPVGRNVDEILRVVQAYQFTDKSGEVCPASWRPGGDTMKPDPKGSLEYFS